MVKICAKCQKNVYPLEELKCLDKIWHKSCFRCTECNMLLNMKNYKGYDKMPYCVAHIPKAKATSVAMTPEITRIANNTKIQSQVHYHEDFVKNIKGSKKDVVDDPVTSRVIKVNAMISSNNYKDKKPAPPAVKPRVEKFKGMFDENRPSPASARCLTNSTHYSSDGSKLESGKVQQGRQVGSIADYDPVNNQYGSIASSNKTSKFNGENVKNASSVKDTKNFPEENAGDVIGNDQTIIGENVELQKNNEIFLKKQEIEKEEIRLQNKLPAQEYLKQEKEFDVQKQEEEELQKAEEPELQQQKELELQKQRELEIQQQKELVLQKELEIQQQKDLEIQQQKELEIQQQKELEIQQQKELEIQQQKELEIQQQRELEIQQQKELAIQQQKELEIQQQRELEIQQQRELEIQQQKELEIQQQRELELKKEKELDLQRERELEIKKQNDEETKKEMETQEFNESSEKISVDEDESSESLKKSQDDDMQDADDEIITTPLPGEWIAMYDFTAQDDDEVSFEEDDIIIQVEKIDDGWYLGTVLRTNQRGMLPSNYIQRKN